jgi:hypothetical protein
MLPRYEILHSGEYWKLVRDNRVRRKALMAAPAPPDPSRDVHIDFSPHPDIITFAPTRAAPFYSRVAPNGSLVPAPDAPEITETGPFARIQWLPPTAGHHAHAPMTSARRTNQEEEDARLLAHLTSARHNQDSRPPCKSSQNDVILKPDQRCVEFPWIPLDSPVPGLTKHRKAKMHTAPQAALVVQGPSGGGKPVRRKDNGVPSFLLLFVCIEQLFIVGMRVSSRAHSAAGKPY